MFTTTLPSLLDQNLDCIQYFRFLQYLRIALQTKNILGNKKAILELNSTLLQYWGYFQILSQSTLAFLGSLENLQIQKAENVR